MAKHYLSSIKKKYRICYLHNPKHFFLNTLWIEDLPNGNKLLCAYPRPHSKPFNRLAILKPIKQDNKTNRGPFPQLIEQAKLPRLFVNKN